MKTHIIIGQNINTNVTSLQDEYAKNGNSLVVRGNGKSLIDCKAIKLPDSSRIIVNADGGYLDAGHVLDLCTDSKDTGASLQTIASKKVVNIELISCFGGGAINAIKKLAVGSTLITFVDTNSPVINHLIEEIELKIAGLLSDIYNPFIQFLHYIMLNPDTNQFAIKTIKNAKTFVSSTKDLQNYSTGRVKAWQKKVLLEFAKFCNEINDTVSNTNKIYIAELLALLENNDLLTDWLKQFDTIRYKELLLMNMARDNEYEAVNDLLESGVNIESTLYGSNALSAGAISGSIDVVKFLWSKGIKLDTVNNNGDTSLYIAAQGGHLDVVKFLWSKKANLDTKNINGASLLFPSIEKGNLSIVKFFVSKGVRLDFVNQNGCTPLLMAAQSGSLEIVKLINTNSDQLNIADNTGVTPLLMASQKGYDNIVKYLINKGTEINISNIDGATPLYMASQQGSFDTVKVLVEAKAIIDQKVNGMTALLTSGYQGYKDIVKLLLAAGANPNEKYNNDKILDWISLVEIKAEINLFNKSPIQYILKGNNDADLALTSLQRAEKFSNINPSLLDKIHKTEECLKAQNVHADLDLSSLCGEDGAWYHSEF